MWKDAVRRTHVKKSFEGQKQVNHRLGPIHYLILNVFIMSTIYLLKKKMGNRENNCPQPEE